MKKPTCLILTLIGVVLLILGLVFVAPWFVNIYQDIREIADQQSEYRYSLRQDISKPLTGEQEQLLSQLLEIANDTPDIQNPDILESILSTEPYIAYLKMIDGQDYPDYPAYIAAMPTEYHISIVEARLGQFLESELEAAEQDIWVNCYYKMREWSKTGNNQLNNRKEFSNILEEHLTDPLTELHSGKGGFDTKFVKMGVVSASMVTENEVFHFAWRNRLQLHGRIQGYLQCAIVTPAEFALMRSFFEDAATFENWLIEPFIKEKEVKEEENQ